VLTAIAITPSAPVLVPELAGAAAREVSAIRSAAIEAAAALPDQWIAIGVGPAEVVITGVHGTFAGYGADVPISLCPETLGPVAEMPLCGLFAGWLRGQANRDGRVSVRVYPADLDDDAAYARGRLLRDLIDRDEESIGVLVVADGFNTLGPSAPGGEDPEAGAAQAALDDALAVGDTAALARLPRGVVGRVAYQVLAGMAGPNVSARQLVRGAPFGVGYFVGLWLPG
jgi:hypothetical protein